MGVAIPRYALPRIDLAGITRKQLEPCLENLREFVRRYESCFYRVEQAGHAKTYMEGLLSDLSRKTIEPIAIDHGQHRKPLQHFVGQGLWEDEKVLAELHRHVREDIGDPEGVLILDTSAFPKTGRSSVGVKRQYCGRLGGIANCQVGIFLAYAGSGSAALVDGRLFLPREWSRSPKRRSKAHVPEDLRFRDRLETSCELVAKVGSRLPHAWVVGDEEFGRPTFFRRELAKRGERYVLEVPAKTVIRDLEAPPPKRRFIHGAVPVTPFTRVSTWAQKQPRSQWMRLKVRDTERGPLEVEATRTVVWTKEKRRIGPTEVLLVMRTLDRDPQYWYFLSNAKLASVAQLVHAAKQRQRIEECFERAKGEAGLAQYEVRSWVGWHHHMTLSLLTTWFLTSEARRVGKKYPGSVGQLDGDGLSDAVA
jgi:SRSO17 transposase